MFASNHNIVLIVANCVEPRKPLDPPSKYVIDIASINPLAQRRKDADLANAQDAHAAPPKGPGRHISRLNITPCKMSCGTVVSTLSTDRTRWFKPLIVAQPYPSYDVIPYVIWYVTTTKPKVGVFVPGLRFLS